MVLNFDQSFARYWSVFFLVANLFILIEMKFQESSRFLPVIFSYLPLIVLFSLAAFLYLTYMLVKNLSTSFQTYSKNQTYLIPMFLVGNEQFISIKSLQFSESISQELTVAGILLSKEKSTCWRESSMLCYCFS